MAKMHDEYYKGRSGYHNLKFVVEMANAEQWQWDYELVRIIGDGTVKVFPELMKAITNPHVKRRVIEAILMRKIGAI